MTKNMRVSDIFNIVECNFELKSKFPDEATSNERCKLYNERLNSKRFIDAVLEDMTKKSKNTYSTHIFCSWSFDPELCDSVEAELDQIAKSKVVFHSFEDRPPYLIEVTYRVLRNTLTLSYYVDRDNPIKDSDIVRKLRLGIKP